MKFYEMKFCLCVQLLCYLLFYFGIFLSILRNVYYFLYIFYTVFLIFAYIVKLVPGSNYVTYIIP